MKTRLKPIIALFAGIAVISYFLHVLIGRLYYPDYQWLSQAISDLTADNAPGRSIARFFSTLYGIFSVIAMMGAYWLVRLDSQKHFKIAVLLFAIMLTTSTIGYAFFPLSESGYAGTFQDVMHMIVTGLVVVLTMISMILFAISFKKTNQIKAFYSTLLAITILLFSGIGTGVISPDYFGLVERFSVYTVVLYFGFIITIVTLESGKTHEQND